MKRATWDCSRRDIALSPAWGGRPTRRIGLPARQRPALEVLFHPIMAFIVGGNPTAVTGRSIEKAYPSKGSIEIKIAER